MENSIGDIHPYAQLLRGFSVDFLTGHNLNVIPEIMTEDYALTINGFVISGRDHDYAPATGNQLRQFPGLCVTAHDVVIGKNNAALRFTEHGRSRKDDNRLSSWRGITLFDIEDGKLARGWAVEDYYARLQILKKGATDTLDLPHPAPWDTPEGGEDAQVLALAEAWLGKADNLLGNRAFEWISGISPRPVDCIDITGISIDKLFSAANRAVFYLSAEGTYRGGFPDVDDSMIGTEITMSAAGILTIEQGRVVDGNITFDRLAAHRMLTKKSHK